MATLPPGPNSEACGSDVGVCERGSRSCLGDTWGACEGGVGPAAELCNARDDDCDNDLGVASPDPCVTEREELANGNLRITVWTSTARATASRSPRGSASRPAAG